MTIEFDFDNIEIVEFGIGRDFSGESRFTMLGVDANVQDALSEMAQATWSAMQTHEGGPVEYEPSDKHASNEFLYMRLNNSNVDNIRILECHQAQFMDIDKNALMNSAAIFCYFAKFKDGQQNYLTAVRRATQFKGVLKSRLIQFGRDTLQIVEDKIFKLDHDFDLLIDSQHIYIWRPSAFEFLGGMKQAILDAVPSNVNLINQDLPFVDFRGIQKYASLHPRAARYLASIRSQNLAEIDRDKLKYLCNKTSVEIGEISGQITVSDVHVMGFLEVLDRRRYEVDLVPNARECFKASSRSKIEI